MGGDHLLRRLVRALRHLGEVGGELGIVVTAGNGHATAVSVDRQAALDQQADPGLEVGPRGRERIVGHHQRPHGGNCLDDARNFAGLAGQADGRMQGHHPVVDLGRNLVAELDGEGGVAAG